MPSPEWIDRLTGALLCTAVGDALGLPREGLSRRRAARFYGEGPVRHGFVLGSGMLSDDTEHACMTAQALLAAPEDEARFARSLAWRLRGWLDAMPAAVGWGTLRAIVKLWLGQHAPGPAASAPQRMHRAGEPPPSTGMSAPNTMARVVPQLARGEVPSTRAPRPRYTPLMVVRLPYGLHSAYRDEYLLLAQEWRALASRGRVAVAPADRRLLLRMVDAIEVGLDQIEACGADQYDGPHAELVRPVEREHLHSVEVEASGRTYIHSPASLARTIVSEIAEAHPEALELRWIEIGYAVPLCQNDACEADFEPIVRVDASATLWHVSASLFTWAHSGVWTPPILADTLQRWAGTMPPVDRWCRTQQDASDPYIRFMATYATRLLDGHAMRDGDAWLQRYCRLVA